MIITHKILNNTIKEFVLENYPLTVPLEKLNIDELIWMSWALEDKYSLDFLLETFGEVDAKFYSHLMFLFLHPYNHNYPTEQEHYYRVREVEYRDCYITRAMKLADYVQYTFRNYYSSRVIQKLKNTYLELETELEKKEEENK